MKNTEMHSLFDELLTHYSKAFSTSSYQCDSCAMLGAAIPPKITGVYVVRLRKNNKVLYIGSSGKINRGLKGSASCVRNRLLYSTTPYHFDAISHDFSFGPTSSGVPPKGYSKSIPLKEVEVICLDVPTPFGPAVLEHLLIQGHINQFGDLPEANQKI